MVDACLVDETVDATLDVDSVDDLACVVVDVVNDVPSDVVVCDHGVESTCESGLELATDSTTSGTGLDGYHVLSPFGYDEAKAIDRSIAGANYLFKTLLPCALPIVLSTVCLCCIRPPVVGVGKVELSVYAPEWLNNLDHLLLHVNGADEPIRPLMEEIAIVPRRCSSRVGFRTRVWFIDRCRCLSSSPSGSVPSCLEGAEYVGSAHVVAGAGVEETMSGSG